MNNDLISKAELFNKLAVIKAPSEANEYKSEVYSVIQAMETADVVEVVRCRDCRSGCPEIMNNNGKIEVHYYCDEDGFYHSGDYYCADGERRKQWIGKKQLSG